MKKFRLVPVQAAAAQLAARAADIRAHFAAHGGGDMLGSPASAGRRCTASGVAGRSAALVHMVREGSSSTWHCRSAQQRGPARRAWAGRLLRPVNERILEHHAPPRCRPHRPARPPSAGREDSARATGMICRRISSFGACREMLSVTGRCSPSRRRMPIHQPAGGLRDTFLQADVQPLGRVEQRAGIARHLIVIIQRLAAAHEHHVPHPALLAQKAVGQQHLREHLTRWTGSGRSPPACWRRRRSPSYSPPGWRCTGSSRNGSASARPRSGYHPGSGTGI